MWVLVSSINGSCCFLCTCVMCCLKLTHVAMSILNWLFQFEAPLAHSSCLQNLFCLSTAEACKITAVITTRIQPGMYACVCVVHEFKSLLKSLRCSYRSVVYVVFAFLYFKLYKDQCEFRHTGWGVWFKIGDTLVLTSKGCFRVIR